MSWYFLRVEADFLRGVPTISNIYGILDFY